MSHTPGPWEAVPCNDSANYKSIGPLYADDANHWDRICLVLGDTPEEAHANARIIKAAPDMLAALEEMRLTMPPAHAPCHFGICHQSECGNCKRIAKALGAIAKAKGETT